jgi:hypothetical protein
VNKITFNSETNEESNDKDYIIIDYEREGYDKVFIQSMTNPNSTDVIKAVNIIQNLKKICKTTSILLNSFQLLKRILLIF